jgi:hypothetical protein
MLSRLAANLLLATITLFGLFGCINYNNNDLTNYRSDYTSIIGHSFLYVADNLDKINNNFNIVQLINIYDVLFHSNELNDYVLSEENYKKTIYLAHFDDTGQNNLTQLQKRIGVDLDYCGTNGTWHFEKRYTFVYLNECQLD